MDDLSEKVRDDETPIEIKYGIHQLNFLSYLFNLNITSLIDSLSILLSILNIFWDDTLNSRIFVVYSKNYC